MAPTWADPGFFDILVVKLDYQPKNCWYCLPIEKQDKIDKLSQSELDKDPFVCRSVFRQVSWFFNSFNFVAGCRL